MHELSMMTLREIGKDIRKNLSNMCPDLLPYPQPGMFKGNKILFIFQNPGLPRFDKEEDEVIMDENASFEEVEKAYENTLRTSYLGRFIDDIGLDWNNISITNVVKAPSPDNRAPTMMEASLNASWTKQQVQALNPELIILVGGVARKIYNFLDKNYDVKYITHYAYHMRRGDYKEYVGRLKDELQEYRKH